MASSQHAPALAICWDRHACGATGQGVGAKSHFGLTEWRGKSRLLWSKISLLEPLSCAEAAKLSLKLCNAYTFIRTPPIVTFTGVQ